jgi:hypothetical protein
VRRAAERHGVLLLFGLFDVLRRCRGKIYRRGNAYNVLVIHFQGNGDGHWDGMDWNRTGDFHL